MHLRLSFPLRAWLVVAIVSAALASALASLGFARNPDPEAERIGRTAPEWSFERWVRGPSRSRQDLEGKVVLLRWWTEGCHYCRATLPVLEALQQRHPELVVIGVFHPKPPRTVSDRHVLRVARQLGFSGPIALDQNWRTLERYWLDGHPERRWTSVSFLLDKEGTIRWVHGGGEYHPSDDPGHRRCDQQYRELERVLAQVLSEQRSASR
jgi:thiol-disulfide isomerase/thioredoxin